MTSPTSISHLPSTKRAPRWPIHTLFMSGTITLGMYLTLPYLETLSPPPEPDTSIRSVQTAKLPPPPPPPPDIFEQARSEVDTPLPKLETPRRAINPAPPQMNLEMALGDLRGDFAIEFGIQSTDLTQQVRDLIFDVGELDQAPQPLVKLEPVYPVRAHTRKIDGEVLVEFIVGPDGEIRDIQVLHSEPGDLFTEAALRAVRRWRFAPGTRDGKAVTFRVRQPISFKSK